MAFLGRFPRINQPGRDRRRNLLKISKTEAIKLYGLPLIDFLKCKSSSEAYFTLMEAIHKAFNYSDDFIYRVKKQFPKPLNKHERAFLSLIRAKAEISNDIHKLLRGKELKSTGYDIEKEIFGFIKLAEGKYNFEPDYESAFFINLKGNSVNVKGNSVNFPSKEKFLKKANILVKLDKKLSYFHSHCNDIDLKELNKKMYPPVRNWYKTGPEMLPNKSSIQGLLFRESRYGFKNSISDYRFGGVLTTIHYLIKKHQEGLSLVFNKILDGDDEPVRRKHEILSSFLFDYDQHESRLTIRDDGSIIREKPNLPESHFLNIKLFYRISGFKSKDLRPRSPARYAISFLLINFLKLPNSVNLINRCHECDDIYIEIKKTKNRRFCSDKCRLAWNNRRRIESGEHARYKRNRKKTGKATPSYFG